MPRQTTVFEERARAKVNLTLRVLGKRVDGYHELDSLVAFADVADIVRLDTAAPVGVELSGSFAPSISGENLLDYTLRLIAAGEPGLRIGRVHLEKVLPVAAGVGGGSADAAALLRAVRRANPQFAALVDWHALAVRIGADVAVCFRDRASWMRGLGEVLVPLPPGIADVHAVLVNPCVAVPVDKTARVFRQLNSQPLPASMPRAGSSVCLESLADLFSLMQAQGNDLQPAAVSVVPAVEKVLEALRGSPGAHFARVSGGGPTCFAVFGTRDAAERAAVVISRTSPDWWVRATRLSLLGLP